MDVCEIERHARVRGWIVVSCPRCEEVPTDKLLGCCDGLHRVLTFPNALGEISFQQYEHMHIVHGLEKRASGSVKVALEERSSAGGQLR
jgi:hypothetical protein